MSTDRPRPCDDRRAPVPPPVTPCLHPGVWLSRPWEQARTVEVAERAAALGYRRVVVPLHDLDAVDPTRIAEVFAAAGLEAVNSIGQTVSADVSSDDPAVRERGVRRLRDAAAAAGAMGSRHLGGVVYGCLGDRRPVDGRRFDRTARTLGELADELAALDVALVCEVVNRYETPMLNTADQAVAFVRRSRSDNLWIHLDTFHMNIEERSLTRAIDTALPRLRYLELSQNSRNGVAEGLLDLRAVLAHAVAAGYRGAVGVEAFSAAVTDDGTRSRLSIWRDVFPRDNRIAEDAIGLIAP